MLKTITFTTCKRSELYCDDGTIVESSARHLFRVAAGLESPLLGETAILGQVKRSYYEAKQKDKLSPILNKMFQQAIHVGHRVRVETNISRGAISYSQVTVDILCQELPDLSKKVVSIIGINEMTESILNFLTSRGSTNIILANRTIEKAERVAEKYNATVIPLSEKKRLIELSDVVISATSAPHSLIHQKDIVPSPRKRYFFDLANPQDIADDVKNMSNIKVFNLEEIEHLAQQNIKAREKEVAKCEAIIEEEIIELLRWERNRLFYAERRTI
ncbi:MAG: glutamyl-tRNA reductase [Paludibacteraceae bacterium]|nr:glutamyl-tRNA reductase [Paludibacteraceae bacterium]